MAIVAPTPIEALPTPPSTSDPANFDARADAFFDAQADPFVDQVNDAATNVYNNATEAQLSATAAAASETASAANADDAAASLASANDAVTAAEAAAAAAAGSASAAAGLTAASTTPLTVAIATNVHFTTDLSKPWLAGSMLKLSSRSDPTNVWMAGGIVSYAPLTGAAVFNPTSIGPTGSGSSHSDWNVSLTGEQGPIGATAFATTPEAQAGTRTDVSMSPARVADAIASATSNTAAAKSANYGVLAADLHKAFDLTGTFTLTLLAAATAGDGFIVYIRNGGTGVWTIDPNGSETIDGRASILVYPGEGFAIIGNGSGWRTFGRSKRVKMSTTTIGSSVATVDIEAPFADTEMTHHTLRLIDVAGSVPASLRLKKGGSYLTTGYVGQVFGVSSGFSSTSWSAGMQISFAGDGIVGADIDILGALSAAKTMVTARAYSQGVSAGPTLGGGQDSTASAVQGVRVLMSTGNITAGVVELWGERA